MDELCFDHGYADGEHKNPLLPRRKRSQGAGSRRFSCVTCTDGMFFMCLRLRSCVTGYRDLSTGLTWCSHRRRHRDANANFEGYATSAGYQEGDPASAAGHPVTSTGGMQSMGGRTIGWRDDSGAVHIDKTDSCGSAGGMEDDGEREDGASETGKDEGCRKGKRSAKKKSFLRSTSCGSSTTR